jgi:hypothetical protein
MHVYEKDHGVGIDVKIYLVKFQPLFVQGIHYSHFQGTQSDKRPLDLIGKLFTNLPVKSRFIGSG